MTRLKILAKEGISFMCFINCTLRESSILQGTYFILGKSMPGKCRKVGWTHFAIPFVAYMCS